MKIYTNKTAPSPRRARMFAREKQLDIDWIEIDLAAGEHLSADYLAKVPSATVPALETDDGQIITENLAIATYLEAEFPDNPLLGSTPLEKARVAEWNARIEYSGLLAIQDTLRNRAKGFVNRALPGPENYAQISALAERGLRRTESFMHLLNQRLGESTFVAGDFYSMADITATVTVDFAAWVRVPIPENAEALKQWHAAMKQRPNYDC